MSHLTIPVATSQPYYVYLWQGLLPKAGEILAPYFKRPKFVVVTDENVGPLYAPILQKALSDHFDQNANFAFDLITLPAGEETKNFNQLEQLTSQFVALGVERQDCIIALGGGVIGDITGFAAAIYQRGCDFIQIPTSLLAQVDSSVGGKTAVNLPQGKNLVGAFHQPKAVLIDVDVLATLPKRELQAGYAEVIKYGLINDRQFFDHCTTQGADILNSNKANQISAIKYSIEAKAKIVAADEKEKGQRALLNLGHTFGHALEAVMGYDGRLLHGEAVAIGCVLALKFSDQLYQTDSQHRILADHLAAMGMMANIKDISGLNANAAELVANCFKDKKVAGGKLTFILAKEIGAAFIEKNVDARMLEQFFEWELA